MKKVLTFLSAHKTLIILVLVVLVGAFLYMRSTATNGPEWVTGTVDEGTVSHIVSVSGTMDATQTAELSFPISGVLESVQVREGETVTRGQQLATLVHGALRAEYQDATAALRIAEADLSELLRGLRPEERDISRTEAEIAEEELERVRREQNEKVENAYRTLLSSDLEAKPDDKDDTAAPPVITGTYQCKEGFYELSTYASNAKSGYSYRLSGLETGTFTAYTDTSAPLGSCGLSIRFIEDSAYGTSEWTIPIPNPEGDSYVTNLNTYNLARTERDNAIRAAEQQLALARQNETLDIASPREEAVVRAEARVSQAQARLARVGAEIRDHILVAPFDGTVSQIDPVPGETISTEPVITMISDDVFEITALIPEIDITKIFIGQSANIAFDARPGENFPAKITFVSTLAREIGGVSYFEAKLTLDDPADWLRGGLNADVDIIIEKKENVLRIPRRFLTGEHGSYSVLIQSGEATTSVPVTVELIGNDGYVAVSGLNRGDTIIAP